MCVDLEQCMPWIINATKKNVARTTVNTLIATYRENRKPRYKSPMGNIKDDSQNLILGWCAYAKVEVVIIPGIMSDITTYPDPGLSSGFYF